MWFVDDVTDGIGFLQEGRHAIFLVDQGLLVLHQHWWRFYAGVYGGRCTRLEDRAGTVFPFFVQDRVLVLDLVRVLGLLNMVTFPCILNIKLFPDHVDLVLLTDIQKNSRSRSVELLGGRTHRPLCVQGASVIQLACCWHHLRHWLTQVVWIVAASVLLPP